MKFESKYTLKFRSIIILFNTIILSFFLLIFFLPVFFLGLAFLQGFWRSAWPLAAVIVIILLGLDAYFLANRRFFVLLEREDWPAIALLLEKRVLKQGRYSSHRVKLLGNAYLVLSDTNSALRLEHSCAMAKPSLLETHGLLFGAARVLGNDFTGAARFFQERLAHAAHAGGLRTSERKGDLQWLKWYYGFSMLLDRKYREAVECFTDVALTATLGIPIGLASYFLAETLDRFLIQERDDIRAVAVEGKERARRMLKTKDDWTREALKHQTEVYIVVLTRFIREAAEWLYE